MELNELRGEIDEVDEELARLFTRRMKLSERIAGLKKSAGLPVRDEAREKEKLRAVEALLPPELRPYGAALWKTLFALSRDRQRELWNDLERTVNSIP